MVTDWIYEDNLKHFVEVISGLADYDWSESDWIAVEHGIRATDVEAGRWLDYGLPGSRPIRFSAAADPGTSVVFVRVRADQRLEIQITGVIAALQSANMCER